MHLLDLATVPKGIIGKHKQPLNLIFNYLDLDSSYSICMTTKESKQLVCNCIQQRCKQPSRKRVKQRLVELGKFFVTDEFSMNFNGIQRFGKCMKYLEVTLFDYSH